MNEAAFKTILHRIKGAPDKREQGGETKPNPSPAETLAAQALAEYQPSEAHLIVKAWQDIMGVDYLNPDTVRAHLEGLRKWQSRWHRG